MLFYNSAIFRWLVGGHLAEFRIYRNLVDLFLQEFLQFLESGLLVGRDERDRQAFAIRAAGRSADAVYVILRIVWNVEIDDKPDVVDVDATRYYVRRHENVDMAVLFKVEVSSFTFIFEEEKMMTRRGGACVKRSCRILIFCGS